MYLEYHCGQSPRPNWDSSTLSPPSESLNPHLPPGTKGGGDTLVYWKGGGGSQFRRLEKKSPVLCLLFVLISSLSSTQYLVAYLYASTYRKQLSDNYKYF